LCLLILYYPVYLGRSFLDLCVLIVEPTIVHLVPGEVAEALGIESKMVSKVINELRKEGKDQSPKRCYYAPL
jgi:predicted transcriptional regulator